VEAVFAGSSAAVAAMIADCKQGPSSARVTRIDESEGSAQDLNLRPAGGDFSSLPDGVGVGCYRAPDAVRRSSRRSADPGPFQTLSVERSRFCAAPLRAASRPGHEQLPLSWPE
jgi:hypothetical protein